MKLGFLTACMPNRSLAAIASWAAGHGYDALEVAAWPDLGDRPFTATHLNVDGFTDGDAEATKELFAKHSLTLSSVAFYDNNLHPDAAERKAINAHVLSCIDAAALLGCLTVGTVATGPSRWLTTCAKRPRCSSRSSIAPVSAT